MGVVGLFCHGCCRALLPYLVHVAGRLIHVGEGRALRNNAANGSYKSVTWLRVSHTQAAQPRPCLLCLSRVFVLRFSLLSLVSLLPLLAGTSAFFSG